MANAFPQGAVTGKKDRAREPFVGNRTNGFALQGISWGPRPMPNPEYFRRQADICLRLSLIASDDEVSNRLITMARSYMAKGDALERDAAADGQVMADRNGSTGGGLDLDGRDLRPNGGAANGPADC